MESNQYTATVYGLIKDQNYTEAVRILTVRGAPRPPKPPPAPSNPPPPPSMSSSPSLGLAPPCPSWATPTTTCPTSRRR